MDLALDSGSLLMESAVVRLTLVIPSSLLVARLECEAQTRSSPRGAGDLLPVVESWEGVLHANLGRAS